MPQLGNKEHTIIYFRSYKRFDCDLFLYELSQVDFNAVYSLSDPEAALNAWYEAFLAVVNRRAPIRKKKS
jgi:hypothetical protein